jgi:hypothetical protein
MRFWRNACIDGTNKKAALPKGKAASYDEPVLVARGSIE